MHEKRTLTRPFLVGRRKGRDSNSRSSFPDAAFRVRCLRPLSHLSVSGILAFCDYFRNLPHTKLLLRGSVLRRRRHASVTHKFLVEFWSTPPQRRRASGFRFPDHSLPKAAWGHKCKSRLMAVCICDPTGNRTPISAVKGPRPNR